ncbi:MAG TPA: deaminase [Acidimicrobiales bacterium]|nr:deaminase [Acidimicrobiales bacterium]
MSIAEDAIVFGLTGAFGSGCSTLAYALETKLQFARIKLSDLIMEAWREGAIARGETGGLDTPPRGALQDLGDEYRKAKGLSYWPQHAVSTLESKGEVVERIVLDGIRNPGEVEWLRLRFKRFYLLAVDTHPDHRWQRLEGTPAWEGKTRADFDNVSARDIEAPEDWGQRVQQCVDLADCVITNDEDDVPPKAQETLLARANDFLRLCGEPHRRPSDEEWFMHLAYSTATGSACLKRNVGAVIVRPGPSRMVALDKQVERLASVVSVGFNENPDWMQPCHIEYKACFRDIWRKETWEKKAYRVCPHCGAAIGSVKWPYRCPNRECPSFGSSLLESFFPERAMTKCTALHAEVRAILNSHGEDLAGCHLYATTFPCFLCAEQILQAGLNHVVYVEPYPDRRSEQLLIRHGVSVKKFDGVKSNAFSKIFGPWRAEAERQASMRIVSWSASPNGR